MVLYSLVTLESEFDITDFIKKLARYPTYEKSKTAFQLGSHPSCPQTHVLQELPVLINRIMTGDSFSRGWRSTSATLFFTCLSLIALKEMGGTAVKINESMVSLATTLKYPESDQTLRKTYTGIESLDYGMRHIVAAFLPGVAGWDINTQVQQIYFLASFFPIISIWSVEAGRQGNASSFLRWTSVWALFYQTVGGAVVIPLWYVLFFRNSAKQSSWSPASRLLDISYAKALFPALSLGYLLPTIALYIPFPDSGFRIHQAFIVLWQPSPLYVNLLIFIISTFITKQETTKRATKSQINLKYLHRVYSAGLAVSAIVHIVIMALCISQRLSQVSFVHSLLHVPATERLTLSGSLHYLFQVDCLVILTAALASAWGVMWDLKNFGKADISTGEIAIQMTVSTVLLGPGATVAGVWLLREHMMADKFVKKA
ncbi:uncharacterized protein RCO7_01423 [Rhynchosporium graminicola]|uniref:Uncharacterized protein n=1 Tax=Rhynchosporium graminicola TaxID=2792576 RepID=A0A1E1JZJ4_9HELO|nr:uncharacterized protein RCO7_01423 [Rhynchosporium commune]